MVSGSVIQLICSDTHLSCLLGLGPTENNYELTYTDSALNIVINMFNAVKVIKFTYIMVIAYKMNWPLSVRMPWLDLSMLITTKQIILSIIQSKRLTNSVWMCGIKVKMLLLMLYSNNIWTFILLIIYEL